MREKDEVKTQPSEKQSLEHAKQCERQREQMRAWRAENRERIRELRRAWEEKNPEKVRETQRKYRERNREKIRAVKRECAAAKYRSRRAAGLCARCGGQRTDELLCASCRAIQKRLSLEHVRRLRRKAYEAYGGPKCACCGETEPLFLSIDHVNGGGNAHRKAIKAAGEAGGGFYQWLKKKGYPPGFQVLCQNCNVGKWRNGGVCPHQQCTQKSSSSVSSKRLRKCSK